MIDAQHLAKYVIKPVCTHLGMWSLAAENLLLGTFALESELGTYLRQIGGGPAIGSGQMEPMTHADIWQNWLRYQPDVAAKLLELVPPMFRSDDADVPVDADALIDLRYSVAMTRIHYRRVSAPLPAALDWPGLEAYHKKYYNTPLGKTRPGEFIAAVRDCGVAQVV